MGRAVFDDTTRATVFRFLQEAQKGAERRYKAYQDMAQGPADKPKNGSPT